MCKMSKIKVSVIVTFYNSEETVRPCMDGLIGQTLKEIEIICVDDGSTDSTPDILKEYEEKDPRVRLIRQENGGAGAARNHGLQYAKGDYLSILDGDDLYDPAMLEKAWKRITELNADIAVFSCDFYDDGQDLLIPYPHSIRRKALPEKDPFSMADVKRDVFRLFVGWAWDKLFRRDLIERGGLRFQEQRTSNDLLFVYTALLLAERITVLPDVLAHHRQRAGSLSVTREKSWTCFYSALTQLKSDMIRLGLYERYERDYLNYFVHLSLWNLNTLKEPTHTKLETRLREEWFREMGCTGHPAEYYYDQREYRRYCEVMNMPYPETASKPDPKPASKKTETKKAVKHPSVPLGLSLRTLAYLKANGFRQTVKKIFRKLLGR